MTAAPGRAVDWIVTDLDGTLVDRAATIVAASRAALRRFMDAGGTVVVATGRGEESALPYYRASARTPAPRTSRRRPRCATTPAATASGCCPSARGTSCRPPR